MTIIREPSDADASALSALLAELGYPSRAEEIPGRLAALRRDPDATVFVAEEGGAVVAAATVHIIATLHASRPAAKLTALVVASSARGQGIGRLMVAHAESLAAARGAETLTLTSALRRTEAHEFYRKLGYAHTGVRLAKGITSHPPKAAENVSPP